MKTIPYSVAVLLSLGAWHANAETASKDAISGFDLCMAHFAKPREGRQALEASGWSFQSTENDYQWLTKNVARSVVALGRNTGRNPQGCFASFDGMTMNDAMALAEAKAKALKLARVSVPDAPAGVVWTGQIQGIAATLNVLKPIKYDRHSGAAILMIADQ